MQKQVSKATALGLTQPIPQVISFDTLLLHVKFLILQNTTRAVHVPSVC